MKFKTARIHFLSDVIAGTKKLPLTKDMATMGVAPSDSGEEEGREMRNRAATPLLFFFFFFPVYFSWRCPHFLNAWKRLA